MNVLHLSTYDTGGAFNAAFKLHEELRNSADWHSNFLVLVQRNPKVNTALYKSGRIKKCFRRLLMFLKGHKYHHKIQGIEVFSSPYSFVDITENQLYKQADIIHFHWVSFMIDLPSFFRKNIKPVIWTFHDLNPCFGGIHYPMDLAILNEGYLLLENRYRDLKRRIIESRKFKLICISPTVWIQTEAKKTDMFDVRLVRYPEREFDNSKDPNFSNEGKRKYGIVASDLNVKRKGFHLITHLFKNAPDDNFYVIGIKANQDNETFSNVHYLGYFGDKNELLTEISGFDGVIIPSLEDNLPNVMLESLICGTPVLGFKVGGLTEIIRDGFNGLLSENQTQEDLLESFIKFRNMTFNRDLIANDARVLFSPKKVLLETVKIYEEALGN